MKEEITIEVGTNSARSMRSHVIEVLPSLSPRKRVEIEMAVSELVSHGIESGAQSASVSISTDPKAVVVDVNFRGGSPSQEVDPIRRRVLESVTESWWVEGEAAGARLLLRPRSNLTLDDLDERELFERLEKDDDARDILYERYHYLADRISRRFRGKGLGTDDVSQVADFALVKAMGRFDPDHGAAFASFAARTISGELKRFLRDRAWSVRVPRGLQERVLEVNSTSTFLTQRLGRAPTVEEIANEMNATPDEVIEAMGAGSAYRSESLDAPAPGWDDRGRGDLIGDDDARVELSAAWSDLGEALESLDDRDIEILHLRFYQDMTQSEIAERVGVSQMHVSRLIRSALATLRDRLE